MRPLAFKKVFLNEKGTEEIKEANEDEEIDPASVVE